MIWSRGYKRPVNWWEIAILSVILLAVFLSVRGCNPAKAEWVTIEKFGGVNTDVNPSRLQMGEARYAVGVYLRDGQLFNGDYMRYTGISYVSKEPCNVLSRMANNNGMIFDNGWLQWYDATGDSSYILEDTVTTVTDSCTGIQYTGDAGWVGAPRDMLSRYGTDTSLAKFNLSQISSLRLKPTAGGVEIVAPLSAIYSEKYIRLRDTGSIVNATKYYWKTFGTVIGRNNLAALSTPDTTWFFNGTQMTTLTNNDITKTTPHILSAPPDTGTISYVSSTAADTVYGQLRLKGTAATFTRSDKGKYVYLQDTSLVYTGQIARIHQFDSGGAGVFLRVNVDTALRNRVLARYAAANLRVQIFAKAQGSKIVANWVMGEASTDTITTTVVACSTDANGQTYARQRYMNVVASDIFGPVYGPLLLANPRSDDNSFWEWQPNQAFVVAGVYTVYKIGLRVIPIRKVPGSSTRIRILLVQDSLTTGGTTMGSYTSGPVYRWGDGFPTTSATSGMLSKTSNWTVVENHRGRAFYTGNKLKTPWDSTVVWAWSGGNHYDSIAGRDRFEGDAAVIGLSSLGSNLIFYRKRPPNAILSMSGFSTADFYMTPLSAGVNAVSDQSIARNPLDEADYFPNQNGMWRCDGSSVSEVPTSCRSIFRDSINWAAEDKICGAVFDNHYWLAAPFGTSTVNNRFLSVDLTSGGVTFIPNYSGWEPGSIRTLRIPGFRDRMFAGASDTGMMFEIAPPGTYAELRTIDDLWKMGGNAGDWRSGWMDFGDPVTRKRINNFQITFKQDIWYFGATADSIIVSFYKDFSSTAAWSWRFGNAEDSSTITKRVPVSSVVQGAYLSFGIQFKGGAAGISGDAVVSRFAMDVVPVGTVKPR